MISIIKLADGTEVIGTISSKKDGEIKVEDPLQINYRMKADTSIPVIYMLRYMPFSKEHSITFNRDHIIAITEPMAGLEKYYSSMLKTFHENNTDEMVNKEFSEAASEEMTEEMQVKLAMMEKDTLKILLN